MEILILGGGTVGSSIAYSLSEKKHNVTIVDRSQSVVGRLNESFDIRTVAGSASSPSVLKAAGAANCDLCLALTSENETNLAACAIAHSFGAKRTVARVYSDAFYELQKFAYRDCFHIDRLLGIDYLTAVDIARRIRDPGSMMIENFAQGYTEMQEVLISRESDSTGVKLANLKLPGTVRVGSIKKPDGHVSLAQADHTINPGDLVTFIGEKKNVEEVKKLFVTAPPGRRSILIAGGGEVAYNLAKTLQTRNYTVRILESDNTRADYLSARLKASVLVLRENPMRRAVLEDKQPELYDYFIAATDDDEKNLVCSAEAKSMGAKRTIAVVKHVDYSCLTEKLGIDVIVCPHKVLMNQVEGLLQTGPVISANNCLLGNGVYVLELKTEEGAKITTASLKDCGVPKNALIASVVRGTEPSLPGADFVFQPGDIAVALVHQSVKDKLADLFKAPQKPSLFSFLGIKQTS